MTKYYEYEDIKYINCNYLEYNTFKSLKITSNILISMIN